jgi:hypothetical protein
VRGFPPADQVLDARSQGLGNITVIHVTGRLYQQMGDVESTALPSVLKPYTIENEVTIQNLNPKTV